MNTTKLLSTVFRFHTNEEGVTSVEYAVMLALIAAVCVAAINSVGGEAGSFWSDNSEAITTALNE